MADVLNYFKLNSFALKIIAIITMAIDHIGAVFFPETIIFRIIGRLSFPIFCFLLVEGFYHTHDVKKYMIRMGIFALISEIPFDLAFNGTVTSLFHQNVFFTLFLGLVVIYILNQPFHVLAKVSGTIFIMVLSEFLRTDYSSTGIMMILLFYAFKEQLFLKVLTVSGLNFFLMGGIQSFGALSMIPISLYNGKQGLKVKYIFYIFYPLHLFIIFILRYVILR